MHRPRSLKSDEPLDTRLARLASQPLGCRNVHRMEGFFSARNVETDRIDHAKRAGDRAGNRLPVVNIGSNSPELRIIVARRPRLPGCDANRIPFVMQMTHDPAPEKTGPTKHSNNVHHGAGRSL